MNTLIAEIKDVFALGFEKSFPEQATSELIEITPATQSKFGHYQCNSAMKLTKILGKPPREIAASVIERLEEDKAGLFEKLEIAGPGFINIWLKSAVLESRIEAMLTDKHLGVPTVGQHHKMVIDFSSPNIAKEMHVGHLRSTIIGDAIARLFEFLDYDVKRLNHLGDWGTQFGMLIAYLKKHHPKVVTGEEACELTSLVTWYKAAKKEFDEDPTFKKQSQLEVVALQQGEAVAKATWEKICEISQRAYSEIYQILDVEIEDRGESFYNAELKNVVDDLTEKGLITISDGAKCIYLDGYTNREGEPLPLIAQKADGGFNYASTDLAAIRHRIEDEKGDRLIYVTDAGQATHFSMVFKAAEKAGYLDPTKVRVDHVPFGVVLGPDGKKFKTRSGETEKLIDLINEAVARARSILNEKQSSGQFEGDIEEAAKAIGIGAIKYADLSSNRNHDYVFSYDKMLSFEGNTAAYLLYAYVRINGIERKAPALFKKAEQEKQPIRLQHPAEVTLALHLTQLPEVLVGISNDLLPNRLCEYLYQLSEKFNAFFRDCRVIGSPEEIDRTKLCIISRKVLSTGIHLLGLHTVERM